MEFPRVHLVVMGVTGAGKSTIAGALSRRLGWGLAEADEFHPESNISRMSQGIALRDEDRWPWLERIRDWMTDSARSGHNTVLTCSALKRSYRDLLATAQGAVLFLHLDGDPALVAERMRGRAGHFMPPTLLPSQLAALEPLDRDELAGGSMRLDVIHSPEALVEEILTALKLRSEAALIPPPTA